MVDAPREGPRRRGLMRTVRATAAGLALGALAFAGGFVWFADHIGTMLPPDPREADAIIVLTGGQSRIETAVELLRSGKGQRLLISGVNPVAGREDLRRATGGDKSLFSCCVDIDHAAVDTVGNAEESAKWMARNHYASAIIVTNNYHMPRSILEMRRLLVDAEIQPYPVVNTPLDGGQWATSAAALRVLLTEYTKYLAAVARGVFSTDRDPQPGTSTLAHSPG